MDSQAQAQPQPQPQPQAQPASASITIRTWFEVNRRKLLYAGAAAFVLLAVVLVFIQQQAGKEQMAGKALSDIPLPVASTPPEPGTADKLLRVANDYKGTKAAANALELSAGVLYSEKEFGKARERFNSVIQQYPESPWVPDAHLGIAACLEAEGKTDEALKKYEDIRKRFATTAIIDDVKLALARLYENSNPTDSFRLYEELMKGGPNSGKAQEAGLRQEDLVKKHPDLAKLREPVAPPAGQPPIQVTPMTNRPIGSNRTISLTNLIRRATNSAGTGATTIPTIQVSPKPADAPAPASSPLSPLPAPAAQPK